MINAVMACLGVMLLAGGVAAASGPEVPRISKEQLKSMLGDPNVVVIDVRIAFDWKESNSKIKGAIRENPARFDSWFHKYPKDKTIVLYCA
jgi:rhodanese-related sulfurtransferase